MKRTSTKTLSDYNLQISAEEIKSQCKITEKFPKFSLIGLIARRQYNIQANHLLPLSASLKTIFHFHSNKTNQQRLDYKKEN